MRRFTYYGSFASVVYFTDLFGVPAAAYSLRKLSPDSVYSGAAIRVRRSSDNTEQDIPFVSSAVNAVLDTTALLAFVGSGNGFVTVWYNQDGSGNDVTQTTAANQPEIVNAGSLLSINSLPSIKFDGSNDSLNATSLNVANIAQTTAESVFKLNSTANSIALTISEIASGQIYLQWTNAGLFRNYYRNMTIGTTPTTNQALMSFYSDSVNAIFYQDSNQIASYAAGGSRIGVNGISIGRWSNGGLFSNVNYQEVIIWNGNKQSDRAAIQTNINDYYNVF